MTTPHFSVISPLSLSKPSCKGEKKTKYLKPLASLISIRIPMSQTLISPSLSFTSHHGATSILSHRSFSISSNPRLQIKRRSVHGVVRIRAMSDQTAVRKMNLNEYMVSLDRPLGIRFALSVDGRVFVHSMKRGGNAEKSRIIMVGDSVKKANDSSTDDFIDIKNLNDTENIIKNGNGPINIVLERPSTPYPIHELPLNGIHNILFNKGRVGLATWNPKSLFSSETGNSNPGFAVFSPKLLSPKGWALLAGERNGVIRNNSRIKTEIVGIVSEEEEGENVEWAFGGFPLEEYIKALDRGKGELYYNHSLGMQFSKITEQIYVGSCIQTEKDVETLSNDLGITAVLNFQSERERINWGINSNSINSACTENNILMINYPIREVDSTDLRKKLPFCVGLLLRLLRKNYKIYVTCTTGFDRGPTCVIAYLHWIQDTALHLAFTFVTGPHPSRPNRAAIVWATYDLIALAENGKREGPPTHSVNFVWNNGREGEEVCLIGDFTNDWKDNIKMVHKGGPRYEAEIRLRHGKYYYKFIVGGQWKHSSSLPTETDERGNVNNVIRVGDIAQIRPSPNYLRINDPTVVKVIERALTEDERFLLAFAARRMAFAICPLKFSPKQ